MENGVFQIVDIVAFTNNNQRVEYLDRHGERLAVSTLEFCRRGLHRDIPQEKKKELFRVVTDDATLKHQVYADVDHYGQYTFYAGDQTRAVFPFLLCFFGLLVGGAFLLPYDMDVLWFTPVSLGLGMLTIAYGLLDALTSTFGMRFSCQVVKSSCVVLFGLAVTGKLIGGLANPDFQFSTGELAMIPMGNTGILLYDYAFANMLSLAVGLLLTGYFNIYCLQYLFRCFSGKYLWLRSLASTAFGTAFFLSAAGLIRFGLFVYNTPGGRQWFILELLGILPFIALSTVLVLLSVRFIWRMRNTRVSGPQSL